MDEDTIKAAGAGAVLFGKKWGRPFMAAIVIFTVLQYFVTPKYQIWLQEMEGRAILAKARYSKQALIEEEKAKEEASKYKAQAEIIQAKGAAEAHRIIGESLANNKEYLHYLFIKKLGENNNDVIYIPTEAGMPILEAGSRERKKPFAMTE